MRLPNGVHGYLACVKMALEWTSQVYRVLIAISRILPKLAVNLRGGTLTRLTLQVDRPHERIRT